MSKVLIIGGHGKVAQLLTPLLIDQGHTVTSVIRSEDQVETISALGAQAVVLDVSTIDSSQFADLIQGHDAVIWSAGAGGGSPERTYRIDRDAAIYSMQGALQAGVQRYIMVSWYGSYTQHGTDPAHSFFPYAQSKMIADAVLRDSELNWTVVAPSLLTLDPPTGKVDQGEGSTQVSRADVAAVVAQCIADPTTIGRTLRFNNGGTPITEYVSAK